jgi:membrane protein required for colicin V production
LNWLDIVLGAVILFGAIGGYREGFIMEVISLLAIFLGVVAGFKFLGMAMVFLDNRFEINKSILPFVAFAAVFVIIMFLVSLLGRVIKGSMGKSVLGQFDQILGGVVGIAKTVFMLSVVLWIVDSLEWDFFENMVSDSRLATVLSEVAPSITAWVGELIPFVRDIFNK